MFISSGEIARGQWIIEHSVIEKKKGFGDNTEMLNPLAGLLTVVNNFSQPIPHLVMGVELPFVVVANCNQVPCITFIWRTDEKNFVEVTPEFVQAYDPNAWHRGQRLLDPKYKVLMPELPKNPPSEKYNFGDPGLGYK
jgi:hypothetical protein